MSLANEMQRQIQQKRQIITKAESGGYYENISVETKHSTKIKLGPFKVCWDIWYTYHTETRYNEGKYKKDLADADAAINKILSSVDSQHAYYSSHYRHTVRENLEIDRKLVQTNKAIQQKLHELQEIRTKEALPALLRSEEQRKSQLEAEIVKEKSAVKQQQELYSRLSSKLKQQMEEEARWQDKTIAEIDNSNMQERAAIFAKWYGEKEKNIEFVMLHLVQAGFNIDYLAYIAIKEHNADLLKQAISMGADLDGNMFESKTLLQHAVVCEDHQVIDTALRESDGTFSGSWSISCINSIQQGDIKTVKALVDHNPNIACRMFYKYTLLQHAISAGMKEIVDCILQANPSSIHTINAEGDNAFKTALIGHIADPENIKLLSKYTNIEYECTRLLENGEKHLVRKLQDMGLIDANFAEPHDRIIKHDNNSEHILSDTFDNTHTTEETLHITGDNEYDTSLNSM